SGKLQKGDGDRVRLLAGRAAEHPETQRPIVGALLDEFGKDFLLQDLEGIRIAEETGHADEDVLEKSLDLLLVVAQIADVSIHPLELLQHQPPCDAPSKGAWFVMAEVHAGHFAQQLQNLTETIAARRRRLGGRHPIGLDHFYSGDIRMTSDARELLGDSIRGEHEIYAPGGDGAA